MPINEQIELARRYVEGTGVSVFLTGKAGTGKTTFLREVAMQCPKRHVVLAPTGVAAVNAGGMTIHSFFQLPFEPYLPDVKELVTEYQMADKRKGLSKNKLNIIKALELLIIDEVSMVRADLMDAVDMMLRRYRRNSQPFGGVQLLLIGDVHQLAPVVTDREKSFMEQVYPSPYFFCSKALQKVHYVTIELTHVYRQQDAAFVELLNHVRDNQLDERTLERLNSRVERGSAGDEAITLTTHNRQADAINRRHMDELKGEQKVYKALVNGNFPEISSPVDKELEVKVGERVMFVKNDSSGGHRYYNGKLATVTGFATDEEGREYVEVIDDEGDMVMVGREVWENMKYTIVESTGEIVQEVDGTFSQYPLRAAWAVTIHKAQGLTFDKVRIDAAAAFAFGQVYVALSRCRTLEGLTLTSPLTPGVAFGDHSVAQFTAAAENAMESVEQNVVACEQEYRLKMLMELFGMEEVVHDMGRLYEHYAKLRNIFPDKVEAMRNLEGSLTDLQGVSERFERQLMHLSTVEQDERAKKGAEYYRQQLGSARGAVAALTEVDIDNKETSKAVKEAAKQLKERLDVKLACMEAVMDEGYSVATVQKAKWAVAQGKKGEASESRKRRTTSSLSRVGEDSFEGPVQEELVALLSRWRKMKAEEIGKPAFVVFNQKTLMALATYMPRNERELLAVPGIGKAKAALYGQEILDIVAGF